MFQRNMYTFLRGSCQVPWFHYANTVTLGQKKKYFWTHLLAIEVGVTTE